MNKVATGYKLSKHKKLIAVALAIAIISCTAIVSFAADGDPSPDTVSTITTGIQTMYNTVASNFNFTNIVTFLSIPLAGCALLALGWFGVRKVIAMIQTALKKGKVRI